MKRNEACIFLGLLTRNLVLNQNFIDANFNLGTILAKNNNLTFKEHLSFGKDYAKTLSIWKNNFLLNWSKIKKLGYDENFRRLWEYYLTYCEVGFINGSIDVSQFLLEKKIIDND